MPPIFDPTILHYSLSFKQVVLLKIPRLDLPLKQNIQLLKRPTFCLGNSNPTPNSTNETNHPE